MLSITHTHRNFKSRNDGNSKTMNFLASPEIVTAMAFSGKLSFNPMSDELVDSEGTSGGLDVPLYTIVGASD